MSESPPARTAEQERVEELCVSAIRAISGEPDLQFRGRLLHRGRERLSLHAPHLYPSLGDDFASFRGAADGMALRLRHSDADLHRALCPDPPVERALFEMLEQFRVESLAPATMPGVVENLRHRHVQWSLGFHRSGLTDTAHGILLYTVTQIARARVTGERVVEATEGLLEDTRGGIAPLLGDDLAGLRRQRSDQHAYAAHARAIARVVAGMLAAVTPARADTDEDADTEESVPFPLFIEFDDRPPDPGLAPDPTTGRTPDHSGGYRAFTTAYDRERHVSTLVRAAQLRDLRQRLDDRVAAQGVNVARLARQLRALLADPVQAGWDGGQEEGQVDGRRLAQLVTSPTERRLFQVERIDPAPSALVTFLVDCSGSMKAHAEAVALLVDVLGRALELAGASCEILGFTTGAWNGGRALRDWRRAGRPRAPGRLNEVTHIVFKDADTSWRRARAGVAGMMKGDLFREGVDGEAVDWACARMAAREEERRLLVVISDGSPMDSATALVNGEHFLDDHLKEVVHQHELRGSVRILGLGMGLGLTAYYGQAHALDISESPSNAVFRDIAKRLAGSARR